MKGCAKNLFIGIGVIFVIIIIAAVVSNGKSNSNTQQVANPSSSAGSGTQSGSQSGSAQATATPGETITIAHSVFKDTGYGYYSVDGEATNNDSIKHTATLKATFYDASNNILGTAEGSVSELAPDQTKTFTLSGNDKVTGYKSLKVQVDTLL